MIASPKGLIPMPVQAGVTVFSPIYGYQLSQFYHSGTRVGPLLRIKDFQVTPETPWCGNQLTVWTLR